MIWLAFLLVGFAGSFFALGATVTTIRFLVMALWAALGIVLLVASFGAVNFFRRRSARSLER